eukprot:TRINITY_DN4189_c0_g1_i1.p1 TRINITY_DN4189_c0_g1~~TRINITY_DN4189_c0_g1_i1.p1  ORF type:complete len:1069 (-),score=391.63 TRINITY_DN4189_c0_g1_i1:12-3218(-)
MKFCVISGIISVAAVWAVRIDEDTDPASAALELLDRNAQVLSEGLADAREQKPQSGNSQLLRAGVEHADLPQALLGGAPQMHFDCEAGLESWRLSWSEKKKEWCCRNGGVGRAAPCSEADSVEIAERRKYREAAAKAMLEARSQEKAKRMAAALAEAQASNRAQADAEQKLQQIDKSLRETEASLHASDGVAVAAQGKAARGSREEDRALERAQAQADALDSKVNAEEVAATAGVNQRASAELSKEGGKFSDAKKAAAADLTQAEAVSTKEGSREHEVLASGQKAVEAVHATARKVAEEADRQLQAARMRIDDAARREQQEVKAKQRAAATQDRGLLRKQAMMETSGMQQVQQAVQSEEKAADSQAYKVADSAILAADRLENHEVANIQATADAEQSSLARTWQQARQKEEASYAAETMRLAEEAKHRRTAIQGQELDALEHLQQKYNVLRQKTQKDEDAAMALIFKEARQELATADVQEGKDLKKSSEGLARAEDAIAGQGLKDMAKVAAQEGKADKQASRVDDQANARADAALSGKESAIGSAAVAAQDSEDSTIGRRAGAGDTRAMETEGSDARRVADELSRIEHLKKLAEERAQTQADDATKAALDHADSRSKEIRKNTEEQLDRIHLAAKAARDEHMNAYNKRLSEALDAIIDAYKQVDRQKDAARSSISASSSKARQQALAEEHAAVRAILAKNGQLTDAADDILKQAMKAVENASEKEGRLSTEAMKVIGDSASERARAATERQKRDEAAEADRDAAEDRIEAAEQSQLEKAEADARAARAKEMEKALKDAASSAAGDLQRARSEAKNAVESAKASEAENMLQDALTMKQHAEDQAKRAAELAAKLRKQRDAAPVATSVNDNEKFNCFEEGFEMNLWAWSVSKRIWCCKVHGIACNEKPFNCQEGQEIGWSKDKKQYCCELEGRGCSGGQAAGTLQAEVQRTTQTTALPSAQQPPRTSPVTPATVVLPSVDAQQTPPTAASSDPASTVPMSVAGKTPQPAPAGVVDLEAASGAKAKQAAKAATAALAQASESPLAASIGKKGIAKEASTAFAAALKNQGTL